MLKEAKNSRIQGDIGLGKAISWFLRNDYRVSIPISDSQRYDLVVEKDKGLQKVEVKTTYYKTNSGNYLVGLRTHGGNKSGSTVTHFDKTQVDLLFVLVEDGTTYLFPSEDTNKNSITLGKEHEKFIV